MFSFKNVVTVLSAIVFLADLYLLCVFPSDLVLDLFCGKVGSAELDALEYDYGQLAGYPAGEGIPTVSGIEQFRECKGLDYITFETDSIIPLNAYRLRSDSDKTDNTYRRSGNRVSSRKQWSTFSATRPLIKGYIYNRYYLVRLPDGNYVAAYLDDAYYWKYRLAGRVQLPLGLVEDIQIQARQLLDPAIEKYGADGEKMLLMFSEKRYEQHKKLYKFVQLAVFAALLAVYGAVVFLIGKATHRIGR